LILITVKKKLGIQQLCYFIRESRPEKDLSSDRSTNFHSTCYSTLAESIIPMKNGFMVERYTKVSYSGCFLNDDRDGIKYLIWM
jgi:hypothetical protein